MRYLVLLASIGLVGCATLIHGTDQEVEIQSDPTGAQVEIDGRPVGETPTTATLARNRTHSVRILREGYEPYRVTLRRGRSLWLATNIFNLMIPGLLVDASTGAFYSLDPGNINATLQVADSTAVPDSVRNRRRRR
ncbi:MAG: PEGA domain-containing protein [Salinibacter sp.]